MASGTRHHRALGWCNASSRLHAGAVRPTEVHGPANRSEWKPHARRHARGQTVVPIAELLGDIREGRELTPRGVGRESSQAVCSSLCPIRVASAADIFLDALFMWPPPVSSFLDISLTSAPANLKNDTASSPFILCPVGSSDAEGLLRRTVSAMRSWATG